jgi:hypothetical protein
MTLRNPVLSAAALVALAAGWGASAQTPSKPTAPAPLSRAALLKQLAGDKDVKAGLVEQIQGLGGKPDDVLAGTAPAKSGEDVKDLWHVGATLTPRDSQIVQGEKLLGALVVYNVFMHSLKDCLAGNFLPVAGGPGPSPYAGAGLYDLPGAEGADHPWLMEVGFELEGLKSDQVRLQVNHQQVPTIRLGDTALVGLARLDGGKHFVEITQPPADPQRKTRRFWYTRALRL